MGNDRKSAAPVDLAGDFGGDGLGGGGHGGAIFEIKRGRGGQRLRRRRVDLDKLRAVTDFAIPKLRRFSTAPESPGKGEFPFLGKTIPAIK
jgi:hypothetical protein